MLENNQHENISISCNTQRATTRSPELNAAGIGVDHEVAGSITAGSGNILRRD